MQGEGELVATAANVAATIAASFGRWHARWRGQGFAPVRANWLAAAQGIGTRMVARLADGEAAGRFAGIDARGRLILEEADGLRVLAAAEIVVA